MIQGFENWAMNYDGKLWKKLLRLRNLQQFKTN
jgi:hypothetical protein